MNSFASVFWQEKSSKLIWIFALTWIFKRIIWTCVLTKEINLININRLFIIFFSNQICFLTEKILKIELNFVFWQVKSDKFMGPPKELSTRALHMRFQLRSPNEVSKLRPGWSLFGALLGVYLVSVGSLICRIHGIIIFQGGSLTGLFKRALPKQLSISAL